jgi:hypothetical protein
MEEKIVGNKKEDLPSLDLFHSPISIASLIYRSIYLVCIRSTTPLWFTDTLISYQDVTFNNTIVFDIHSCVILLTTTVLLNSSNHDHQLRQPRRRHIGLDGA